MEAIAGLVEKQNFRLFFSPLREVKPILADEAGIWPSAQSPFVTGEGAPEHSDCQQNGSQSGFTVCSRLFCFLPLGSAISFKRTAHAQR